MKYLAKSKILILLLFVFVAYQCKGVEKKEKEEKTDIKVVIKETSKDLSNQTTESGFNLQYLQGVWKSYSYYLEHEEEDKDEHVNEYYKIVVDNKCLDIIFKDHYSKNVIVKVYDIGFTNNDKVSFKSIGKESLAGNGKFYIRIHRQNYFLDKIDSNYLNNMEISKNYYKDFDTYQLFEDGFKYCYQDVDEKETVQFRRINALPNEVFRRVKEISETNGVNLIKEYHIQEVSKRVKVISQKVYFYSEMDEDTRRKAFLIKDDLAYLEGVERGWAKVYYDGKIVTSGYIKMNDIQIIE